MRKAAMGLRKRHKICRIAHYEKTNSLRIHEKSDKRFQMSENDKETRK